MKLVPEGDPKDPAYVTLFFDPLSYHWVKWTPSCATLDLVLRAVIEVETELQGWERRISSIRAFSQEGEVLVSLSHECDVALAGVRMDTMIAPPERHEEQLVNDLARWIQICITCGRIPGR